VVCRKMVGAPCRASAWYLLHRYYCRFVARKATLPILGGDQGGVTGGKQAEREIKEGSAFLQGRQNWDMKCHTNYMGMCRGWHNSNYQCGINVGVACHGYHRLVLNWQHAQVKLLRPSNVNDGLAAQSISSTWGAANLTCVWMAMLHTHHTVQLFYTQDWTSGQGVNRYVPPAATCQLTARATLGVIGEV
jgi:hypothetical protein